MAIVKISESKELETRLNALADTIDKRREAEKEEKAEKAFFLAEMERRGCTALATESVMISTETRERSSLDKTTMEAEQGREFIAKYTSVKPYTLCAVKRV